jgi:hypothetical protein
MTFNRMTSPTFSQAFQDQFVLAALNHKKNGTFIEIGSNDPVVTNNTYLLESQYNWRGLMVEYDGAFRYAYETKRPLSMYQISDARTVPYRAILDNNDFPTDIDYLQVDLDVDNRSTLDVIELLDKTILNKYRFACMTIEHDAYRGNYFNTRQSSRQILQARGYILAFPDVRVFWQGSQKPFEDWYIHPELAPHMLKYVTQESLPAEAIASLLSR